MRWKLLDSVTGERRNKSANIKEYKPMSINKKKKTISQRKFTEEMQI